MLELYINIKTLRKQLKMTQTELAKKTGYSDRSSITKIEKGEVDIPQSKIALFAKALGTTPRELMGNTGVDYYAELSDDEKILIECYRSADIDLQNTVRRLLAYAEKFKEINNEQ